MARLITRAELARIAGVSPMAITKACVKRLAGACDGKLVDLDHESVSAYLESKGVDPTKVSRARQPPTIAPPKPRPKPPVEEPSERRRAGRSLSAEEARAHIQQLGAGLDVEDLPGMTLQELIETFGTETRFREFLDCRLKIASLAEKELKNDETTGRLIERELVRVHIFGMIDACFRRLLTDTPKTLTRRIYAAARNGTVVEDAEKVVRELLSSQLKPIKTDSARALREA